MSEQRQSLIFRDISIERAAQDHKWGVQRHSYCKWSTILAEETGEVAEAALDLDNSETLVRREHFRRELIQAAAVAVAAIEHLDSL